MSWRTCVVDKQIHSNQQLVTVLFADDTNIFDTNSDLKSLIDNVNVKTWKTWHGWMQISHL